MSQIEDIREAVAARAGRAGLNGQVNGFAYPPADYLLPAVLIYPASGTYVNYHGTFGSGALQTISLIARVVVPESGSPQSADKWLDSLLSSGGGETLSVHDAIVGANVEIGDLLADIHVGTADDWAAGTQEIGGIAVPVVQCVLPITVHINRSAA